MESLRCARYTEKYKQICEHRYFEASCEVLVDSNSLLLHNLLSLALRRVCDGNDISLYRFNRTVS